MWKWNPESRLRGSLFSQKRVTFVINEKFQWRYTRYFVSSVFFAAMITGGVTGYFLNQNYGIFNRLAYLHAPDLLPQLEREQVWINTFLFAFVVSLISLSLIFGLRMTSRMVGPIMVLKRHLKAVSRGIFHQRPIRVRENDEFRDLIETYNYLYQSLQAQVRKDIKALNKILSSKDLKLSQEQIRQLVDEKEQQLTESVSKSGPNSDSRHAS